MTSVRGSRSLVEQVSEMYPGDAVAAAADVMSSDTPRRTHRTAANEVTVVLCNRPQQLSPVSLQGVGIKPTRITVIAAIRSTESLPLQRPHRRPSSSREPTSAPRG